MSAVVEFVDDTIGGAVDFVGDVFEAVGDVFDDVVEVVDDAISDVVDWIDVNIIEPIQEDPITFIVSAVAYAYGIPGLSFAGPGTAASVGIATTGSRLAQGDDFDDAIKAGAMAGVTTGVTNSIAKGVSTGGQDWSPNIYSTADELAANAARGAASGSTGARSAPISSSVGDDIGRIASAGDDIAGDQLLSDLADANALNRDFVPDEFELLADASGDTQLVKKQGASSSYTDPYELAKAVSEAPDAPQGPWEKPNYDLAKQDASPQGPYKPSITDTSDYADPRVRSDTPEPSGRILDPKYGDPAFEGAPVEERIVPGDRPVYAIDESGTPVKQNRTGWDSAKDLGGAVAERAGDWVWDGVKWVWNNPGDALMYGIAGLALLGDKGGPPGDDDKGGGKDEDRQEADDLFYSDLQQLELQRARRDSQFGRSDNPYESGLYTYGEKQGEHQFYGPSVYQPVEYTQPVVGAAQGGSIGVLNSQVPSYYRYGAMPMAMGGYASGGLKSVHEDGRSDHIPAMLSDGEYVIDAETVALLGNGSNEAGANRLEQMRQEVRKQKGKALSKGKFSSNAKSPLAYLKQRRG